MEKEIRNYGTINSYNDESRTIEGYALKFDSPSQFMGFYEVIDRSAIDEALLKKSDIFALFNHDEDKVLARSRYGKGSLNLELRDDGLYYSFKAPNTQWGNEVIEHIKRGEIFGSSFAFAVPDDRSGEKIERDAEGLLHRTITKFERLFDVSPVFEPAYLATTCSKRMLELLEQSIEEERKVEEVEEEKETCEIEDPKEEDPKEEDPKEEEERKVEEENDDNDNTGDDTYTDDSYDKEDKVEDEKPDEEKEQKEENINKEEKNKNSNITMEKQFRLLRTVRAIANNQKLNDVDAAVINAGQEEFRKSGVEYGGQIQLPNLLENRSAITVTAEGEDVVATDIYDILTPLRARNTLVQAGAKFMSGLVSNVQVPIMTASQVTWEGETAPASDGASTFSHVTLSPKRLTAYIDMSKQFLVQDSIGAENVIREDLINAINAKLESTILGYQAGTTTQPAGIFYNANATGVSDFEDIVTAESDIEDANVLGELKYIVSPKAKAAMRSMIKGTNATGMVFENNAVDGTPALSTTNVKSSYMVAGDWSNLAIGQWGAVDLTVDPYTKAADGQVRLVVNAFFDAKVLRPDAFACSYIVQS